MMPDDSPAPVIVGTSRSARPPSDLTEVVREAVDTGRPMLHHLNADSSWLVQLPIPSLPSSSSPSSKRWYNILLDPWLSGPQSDVVSWFSTQWHAIPPHYASIQEVLDLCARVEAISQEDAANSTNQSNQQLSLVQIDLVVISHEFTDHCHRQTLVDLPRSTPIWASTKAVGVIKGFKHFETVVEIPAFGGGDWKDLARGVGRAPEDEEKDGHVSESRAAEGIGSTTNAYSDGQPDSALANPTSNKGTGKHVNAEQDSKTLPHWLRVARLVESQDVLYYHSGVLLIFDLSPSPSTAPSSRPPSSFISPHSPHPEYVLYTPHGLRAASLPPLLPPRATPPLHPLLMLHGLHDVRIDYSLQLNLGAHFGLAAQRQLGARYWVGTHDEIKKGGGVVSWFLRRKRWVLGDALEKESGGKVGKGAEKLGTERKETPEKGNGVAEKDGARYLELGNGEILLLA